MTDIERNIVRISKNIYLFLQENFDQLNSFLFHQRYALFIYWPCFLALGIALYFSIDFEPSLKMSVIVFIILLGIFFLYRKTIQKTASFYFICHAIIAFSLGFMRANLQTSLIQTHFLKELVKNQSFEGIVTGAEQAKNGTSKKEGHRYLFTILKWDQNPNLKNIHTIRLKAKHAIILEPGWRVQCTANLLPISAPVSPVAYNFKRDHFFKMISATGTLKKCNLIEKNQRSLAHFRHHITQKIRSSMKRPYGDISAALITGDRSSIDHQIRQSFTDAGLAHILAISGLHMGLVAGLIFFLTRRLISLLHLGRFISESTPIREISAAITIAATAFYLCLSGYGYPAIRSFFMTTLVMLGILFCRNPLSLRSVALAASTILLLFPESLLSASFQLSFAAVVALIAGYEIFSNKLLDWYLKHDILHKFVKRIFLYFCGISITTLIATMATTPLSMAIFNRFTLQSVLGNLIALPLTAFWIMPFCVISTTSLLFGGSDTLFWVLEKGLQSLVETAVFVSALPGSGILVPTPSDWFYGFFSMGGLLMCVGPGRALRSIGLSGALMSLYFFKSPNLPVGYFAGDRSVIAIHQGSNLMVSSLSRGKFYTDQWRQHLGLSPSQIVLFSDQKYIFNHFLIIADPFKNFLDESLADTKDKKKFLNQWRQYKGPYTILSNAFWFDRQNHKNEPAITGQLLEMKGSAFLYKNGAIYFQNQLAKKRPWS